MPSMCLETQEFPAMARTHRADAVREGVVQVVELHLVHPRAAAEQAREDLFFFQAMLCDVRSPDKLARNRKTIVDVVW